jgi:hypothetical protein
VACCTTEPFLRPLLLPRRVALPAAVCCLLLLDFFLPRILKACIMRTRRADATPDPKLDPSINTHTQTPPVSAAMASGAGGSSRRGLEERQRRAEEGLARFKVALEMQHAGVTIMQRIGGAKALGESRGNEAWGQLTEKAIAEMEAAVELMRDGLPGNGLDVSSSWSRRERPHVCLSVCLSACLSVCLSACVRARVHSYLPIILSLLASIISPIEPDLIITPSH